MRNENRILYIRVSNLKYENLILDRLSIKDEITGNSYDIKLKIGDIFKWNYDTGVLYFMDKKFNIYTDHFIYEDESGLEVKKIINDLYTSYFMSDITLEVERNDKLNKIL